MTDPVDTDALRAFAAESGGSPASFTVWGMTSATLHRSAADEIDRLRDIIAEAPHDPPCPARLPATFTRPLPCTCWKADAL